VIIVRVPIRMLGVLLGRLRDEPWACADRVPRHQFGICHRGGVFSHCLEPSGEQRWVVTTLRSLATHSPPV
jgi:hypothetical protein